MIDAVLWDYDGTLADSFEKNYTVTLDVLRKGVPRLYKNLPPALESKETFTKAVTEYEDWRRLYIDCYGMTAEETERAGFLWSVCQRECNMTAPLYDGVDILLSAFSSRKQGIVSQNSSDEIRKVLDSNGLDGYVKYICGYKDVPQFSPKPSPVPFLKCAELLKINPKKDKVVYIGDHEEDVLFCENIRSYYEEQGVSIKIISVAVSYSGSRPDTWLHKPDYCANSIQELRSVLKTIDN